MKDIERSDQGATAAEYAIMVAFIAAVIALSVAALGVKVIALFQSIPGAL